MTELMTNVALLTYEEAHDLDLIEYVDTGEFVYACRRDVDTDIFAAKSCNISHEYRHILDWISGDDIWLDCGAAIGSFAVPISKLVKRVICIEASWPNFTMLRENVHFNKCDNITIIYGAVNHSFERELTFYQHGKNTLYGTIHHNPNRKIRQPFVVPAYNFDDIFDTFNADFVKMDIEGEEYDILTSSEVLHSMKGIVFEYHESLVRGNAAPKLETIVSLLEEVGLNVSRSRRKSQPLIYGKRD